VIPGTTRYEARVAIINRRACDRARVGSAPTIAGYEVRDTKGNRRARNRSRLGSTVGGYQVTIRTLRQVVLARSGVTGLEKNTVGGYQVTSRTLRQLVLARSGVTGLELDNQPEGVRSVDAKSHSRWLLGNDL
jgi:hypothetical protein